MGVFSRREDGRAAGIQGLCVDRTADFKAKLEGRSGSDTEIAVKAYNDYCDGIAIAGEKEMPRYEWILRMEHDR